MGDDTNSSHKEGYIRKPLTSEEVMMRRRCHCGNEMQPVNREVEDYDGPALEKERGIVFSCESCNTSVWIADTSTIVSSLISGGVLALILLYISDGFIGFVMAGLQASFSAKLIVIVAVLVVAVFIFGTLNILYKSVNQVQARRRYPLIED